MRLVFFLIAFVASVAHVGEGYSAHSGAHVQIEGVPFVAQAFEQCGPAALSSILAYYGEDVSPEIISKTVYDERLKGSLISDLENYVRERGFQTKLDRGSLSDIKEYLDAGRPVIALVDMGRWRVSKPHYLIVFGYSPKGLIAHDGETAARLFYCDYFERIWERAGRVYLLVHP